MALVDCFTRVFAYVQILARGRESGLVVSDETAYGVVRQDVEALIAQGEEQAAAAGTDRELFRQAEFAVCCWIDETLLAADWPGRDEWLKRPLQRTQFNTINGGEEFFSRMDAAQNLDNMELVEVFHACISLGFTGRYYQENQKALLDEISLGPGQTALWRLCAGVFRDQGGGRPLPMPIVSFCFQMPTPTTRLRPSAPCGPTVFWTPACCSCS